MENISNDELIKLRNKIRKEAENKYLQNSKQRLQNIISTKIRTTFIGAIDAFERTFGDIWGYNSDKPLTKSQEELLKLWKQVRNDILDLGNNQLRAAMLELENHTVKWNRYTITFLAGDNNE